MKNPHGLFNANMLKIIALVSMTIDHMGYILFQNAAWMRYVGRISFPIFAFLIAEGCHHTKNKFRYFSLIFVLAGICQIATEIFEVNTKLNILYTFSFSILLIYLLQLAKKNIQQKQAKKAVAFSILFACATIGTFFLMKYTPIKVDYGFWGVMVPVFVAMFDKHWLKVVMFAISLVIVSSKLSIIQWFSLISVLLIWFYNGEKGRLNMKYLFYVYYPMHLVVLYFIAMAI